uniref:Uncharacterized protein MANES_05G116700 n=1 Tax=Rhizophora mucronata TaxID=61149 RepID=A0A2P2JVJ7_RHIMU
MGLQVSYNWPKKFHHFATVNFSSHQSSHNHHDQTFNNRKRPQKYCTGTGAGRVEMALRSSVTARLCLPSSPSAPSSSSSPPSSSASKATFLRPPLRPISASLPITSTATLLALSTSPHEAKAFTLSKEQIFSSVTEVERTIDQVQEVGSSVLETTERILGFLRDALKPGIDVALPIAKQAGEQALKVASPAISEASKKAQEAIESTGIDTKPVLSAAKKAADAAQQTGTVIEKAKPIASTTFETISTTDPFVIVGTAGAAFFVYLLLPSIWSAVSYSLRGYKGEFAVS